MQVGAAAAGAAGAVAQHSQASHVRHALEESTQRVVVSVLWQALARARKRMQWRCQQQ